MKRQKQNRTPKYDGELTFREIGRNLGVSTDAARMTYGRAIRKLRRNRMLKQLLQDYIQAA